MNKIQKIGFGTLALFTMAQNSQAAMIFTSGKGVNKQLAGSEDTADQSIQLLIQRALGFLFILAVCLGLYGGYTILTAAGDDGKLKKGKTILFQALFGLLIIFLAYSIVNWLIASIFVTQ